MPVAKKAKPVSKAWSRLNELGGNPSYELIRRCSNLLNLIAGTRKDGSHRDALGLLGLIGEYLDPDDINSPLQLVLERRKQSAQRKPPGRPNKAQSKEESRRAKEFCRAINV